MTGYGVLLAVFFWGGTAQSKQPNRLNDSQEVIVELADSATVRGVERLGTTNFYRGTIGQARLLRESGRAKAVYPLRQYTPTLAVNDPLEPQAYLNLLRANELWDTTTGAASTVVAIIDSGFALEHEDLANRWHQNSGEIGAVGSEGATPNCTSRGLPLDKSCNNLDDDGNGFIDDWRGWDFAYNDNLPNAGSVSPNGTGAGHGTAVAGMVGATGNNGIGVASLNWNTKLMPLQIFDDSGSATTAELVLAMDYAIQNGADIINLSLGSTATDLVIESLLAQAETAGVIVVAAAGNCGGIDYAAQGCAFQGQTLYPATNSLTIAAAATDLSDARASFSSYGNRIDIAAPGSGAIKTTLYSSSNTSGAYSASIYGTSISTPVVSGMAAILRAKWPAGNPRDIRALFVDSALKTDEMLGQFYTQYLGFGRLRPLQTAQRAQACAAVGLKEDINCDRIVNILDLSIFASQWQLNRGGRSDINQSSQTDLLDLSLLASKWGQ